MNLHEQPANPISFSPAMVEAILAERKNQTRRIIKHELDDRGLRYGHPKTGWEDWHGRPVSCPFGQQGDLLWIREEHRISTEVWQNGAQWLCEFKDGTITRHLESDIPADTLKRLKARKTLGKWQRARFLPRYFARTYLKVTDIQVERLQDISEEDAIAEGIELIVSDTLRGYLDYSKKAKGIVEAVVDSPRESFSTLWEKINGPGSWEASPWVWKIEFEKI